MTEDTNDKLKIFVDKNRSAFDDQVPSPLLLRNIETKIKPKPWAVKIYKILPLSYGIAASMVLLIGTIFFMRTKKVEPSIVQDKKIEVPIDQTLDTPFATTAPAVDSKLILNNYNEELSSQSQIEKSFHEQKAIPVMESNRLNPYVVSLSDMSSASKRYLAATKVLDNKILDKKIIDVLIKTIQEDPNTNVRFAALESISTFANEKYVKDKLVSSLKQQDDPIIQIEMIKILTAVRTKSIIDEMKLLADDQSLEPLVKDQLVNQLFMVNEY
jgi:hypothetical protein